MKNVILTIGLIIFMALSIFAQTTWVFDKAHSRIGFSVTHLVITEVGGNFKSFEGKVVSHGDDFNGSSIEFTADVKSINTDNEKRDNHLRSDDFFNAEKYPELKFKSTSFKKISDNKYKLIGNLTIRNNTKPIELNVKFNGLAKDPGGHIRAGFKITGELNRFDYGLKWNALLEAGGAVVGKIVSLDINVELIKQ